MDGYNKLFLASQKLCQEFFGSVLLSVNLDCLWLWKDALVSRLQGHIAKDVLIYFYLQLCLLSILNGIQLSNHVSKLLLDSIHCYGYTQSMTVPILFVCLFIFLPVLVGGKDGVVKYYVHICH